MSSRQPRICFLAIALCLMLAFGCAGTPKWVGGTSRSEFYYQGVGSAESATSAEERALFSLVAQIEGSEIQSVIEDYNRASSHVSGSKVTATDSSRMRQWISMRIEGKVPAEVRIQERFRDENQEWALAVVERPGQLRRTNRLYQSKLRNVKYHAFVPGWAQVQKRQPRRAYTYIGMFSAGVIGGITFAILSNDANARRDRATIQIEREHYDDLSNRRFWLSSGFYTLAGGAYVVSLLDGILSQVPPYRLLARVDQQRISVAMWF